MSNKLEGSNEEKVWYIFERYKLSKKLLCWRLIAVGLICALAFTSYSSARKQGLIKNDYIARISLSGSIYSNPKMIEQMQSLYEDKNVKAVLLHINSPGGTLVGAQAIYKGLRKLSTVKPVIALIDEMGLSGAYIAAMGTDRIFAYEGSLAGSIGALMQTFEVTHIANYVGVELLSFKSSPFKAAPNPFEQVTPEVRASIEDLVKDMHNTFVDIVKERRGHVGLDKIQSFCNGKVYTGKQSIENGLIDELGNEEEALEWLKKEKQLSLQVFNYDFDQKNQVQSLFALETKGEIFQGQQVLGNLVSFFTTYFSKMQPLQ